METIKDFFKHINYRLSSPIIFSFLISWLFCNWKVTLALVYHDTALLKIDGYTSYIDLIDKVVTWRSGLLLPLLGALIYTFGSPIFKALIHAFQTYFQKLEDNWNLSILKGGKISIDKYISLRESLVTREKTLEELIESESSYFAQLEEQKGINHDLNQEINDLKDQQKLLTTALESERSKIQRITDLNAMPSMLQGTWVKETKLQDGSTTNETIEIVQYQYILTQNGQPQYLGNITHYQFDENNNRLFFVIEYLDSISTSQTRVAVNELTYNRVSVSLEGTENLEKRVKYTAVTRKTKIL